MNTTTLGKTGLKVSALGVGLAEIGFELSMSAGSAGDIKQAGEVLSHALDNGINFLDTAECYKVSEELVGATVAGRRSEFVLATKAGHLGGQTGTEWTYESVTGNVNNSLQRMKTDRVDLVQLHSCGVDVLKRGDVVRALQDARKAGKTRFIGYSGDNEAAHWAVDSGLFDTLQTSFNIVEQQALTTGLLKKAEARGMGVIIKRPIGGATWGAARAAERLSTHSTSSGQTGSGPSTSSGRTGQAEAPRVRAYDDPYLVRAKEMSALGPLPGETEDAVALSLGFTLAHPEVDVAIVGTKNPKHMESNLRIANSGAKLDRKAVDELHRRFEKLGKDWTQRG